MRGAVSLAVLVSLGLALSSFLWYEASVPALSDRDLAYPIRTIGSGHAVRIPPASRLPTLVDEARLIDSNHPPALWPGYFPEPIPSPIREVVYVGRAPDTEVHLFYFVAEDACGAVHECRVLWEEELPRVRHGATATHSTCSRSSDGPSIDILHSGGSPSSALTWGPLESAYASIDLTIDEQRYTMQPRGGYALIVDINLPLTATVVIAGYDSRGALLRQEFFDPANNQHEVLYP